MGLDHGLKVQKELSGEITTCVINLSTGNECETLSFETAEEALADIERRHRECLDEHGSCYETVIVTGFLGPPVSNAIILQLKE